MDMWTEMNTAYHLARIGTVSGTAQELGVHRATINRHIDALEDHLGARLFLRHRAGYQLTEAGQDFLQVAGRASEMLQDFAGRTRRQTSELEGEVIVTTLEALSDLILPGLVAFRKQHPKTRVTLQLDAALYKLEHAEAHVAVRAGPQPTHDDYVVQPFSQLPFGLYAHRDYLAGRGTPRSLDLRGHDIVGAPRPNSPAPQDRWLAENTSPDQCVLQVSTPAAISQAIRLGAGIGFMLQSAAEQDETLVQIAASLPEWQVRTWLVTHVDLHRTAKVQSMLACLKQAENAA